MSSENRIGYLAPELEEKQTIPNLYAFGARLEAEYQKLLAEKNK